MANTFADFFGEKLHKIRAEFASSSSQIEPLDNVSNCVLKQLSSFRPAAHDEVHRIIQQAPPKHCSLDPIPTELLKKSLDQFLPIITRIINAPVSEQSMPSSLKNAFVKPLLKKPSLDQNQLKNYRPVSNLPYISKRVVANRLTQHMSDNNMYESYQSAYRKSHSVETALIRVQNDILQALDKKQCVILVLLDMASAFDTVDYSILLSRLSKYVGINALSWFSSYLSGRHQTVFVNKSKAYSNLLTSGVPQGSVLGPILFSVYTLPLGDIMRRHGVNFHLFADDTQIYATFNIPDLQSTCDRIERCISDVQSWTAANFLKLNTEKTEILLISSRFGKVEHPLSLLNIAGATIHSVSSAKNIGVIFDSNLCLESHINSICRSAYFHLRNIGAMRKYLNHSATAILVHAFIFSKIDLNNSMLINLPDRLLDKLQ